MNTPLLCQPVTLAPPSAAASASCNLLLNSPCGLWAGTTLGEPGGGCKVERFSQEPSQDGVLVHVTSEGCGTTSGGAPFAYERVEAGRDLVVTVQVAAASSVPWSEAGLLVVAEGDGAEWLALRSMMGARLTLTRSSTDGTVESWEAAEAGEPQPWVRLARTGEHWQAWWRRSNDEPFSEMPGSPLLSGPSGAVRVGLTHQTSSDNVGAATFSSFGLGVGSEEGGAAIPPPVLSGAAWGEEDASCLGGAPSLLLDGDAHVELAAPCPLAYDAAEASLSLWFQAEPAGTPHPPASPVPRMPDTPAPVP